MEIAFYSRGYKDGFVDFKTERFQRLADRYYFMRNEYEIVEIHSVKKLIKYLGAFESELTSFAKKGKISASDSEALALLIEYYLELQQL